MKDCINIAGRLRIYRDGVLLADHPNQVTFLGMEAIMRGWGGAAGYNVTHFECGDGTVAPTASDTALGNTTHGPAAIASFAVTGSTTVDITFSIAPGATTTQDFTEFGLFAANGDLIARWCDGNTYSYITTGTMDFVWTFTFTL